MKTVTALRAASPGRVSVELDGERWRTLPLEAVVRAGLSPGRPLQRVAARTLAREVRRLRALDVAGRALRSRDRSVAELDRRLATRGVAGAERKRALETLAGAGLLDDDRVASARARGLAERGAGDALIRHDLEGRGIAPEAIDRALSALEPEHERARRIVERRGPGIQTARYLASRGFDEDAVESAVAADLGDAVG